MLSNTNGVEFVTRRVSPVAILALVFIAPFILAVVLYTWRGAFGGFSQLPNPDRELIENGPTLPTIELIASDDGRTLADGLRSRWSLIYARMPRCEDACREAVERLNQVYLALGTDRVQLVFLAPPGESGGLPPISLLTGVLDAADGAELVDLLGPERIEEGRFFVVDPRGTFILSYPADADQGRLLEDMERLLDVSRIG
jgi:cytochrome oxidase Cu insertion factor (SCO1/SenC/PrrC family)